MVDATERFAILETEMRMVNSDIKELNQAIHEHTKEDKERFDKLSAKVENLGLKVMALATAGGIVGPIISHYLLGGNH